MWLLPLYLHVNQKSDYDDDMSVVWETTLKQWLKWYSIFNVTRMCSVILFSKENKKNISICRLLKISPSMLGI